MVNGNCSVGHSFVNRIFADDSWHFCSRSCCRLFWLAANALSLQRIVCISFYLFFANCRHSLITDQLCFSLPQTECAYFCLVYCFKEVRPFNGIDRKLHARIFVLRKKQNTNILWVLWQWSASHLPVIILNILKLFRRCRETVHRLRLPGRNRPATARRRKVKIFFLYFDFLFSFGFVRIRMSAGVATILLLLLVIIIDLINVSQTERRAYARQLAMPNVE